ncbi:hypothetical protein Tco_0817237, partial [Tanacetum coccineum]
VFERSFMRLTKGIADFGTGTIIIYPELDPFLVSSKEEKIGDDWDLLLDDLDFGDIPDIKGVNIPLFMCKMKKSSRNKRKQLENYKSIYSSMGPLMSTGKPLTQEEAERDALAIKPIGFLRDVLCQVGVTTIIAKFLILDMPIDRDTSTLVGNFCTFMAVNTIDRIMSTFDGLCHQTFSAAKTSLDTTESDIDDEEDDPLDWSQAFQEVMNPFKKICVWKKVASFLGSLPVALQHVDRKPDYSGNYCKK